MVRFHLHCDAGHHFDAWFRSNNDFEQQRVENWLSCPQCESTIIDKALMTPAIATEPKKEKMVSNALSPQERELLKKWHEFSKKIRKDGDYVGENFAQEARKIHYGEAKERPIYGEANNDEIKSMLEEGIDLLPLPLLPKKSN